MNCVQPLCGSGRAGVRNGVEPSAALDMRRRRGLSGNELLGELYQQTNALEPCALSPLLGECKGNRLRERTSLVSPCSRTLPSCAPPEDNAKSIQLEGAVVARTCRPSSSICRLSASMSRLDPNPAMSPPSS